MACELFYGQGKTSAKYVSSYENMADSAFPQKCQLVRLDLDSRTLKPCLGGLSENSQKINNYVSVTQ